MKIWQRMDRFTAKVFKKIPGALRFAVSFIPGARSRESVPFAHTEKPLGKCTVALVTTCGIHPADIPPFDMEARAGDPSYREYPWEAVKDRDYKVSHSHIDSSSIMQDINVALPIDRMKELEDEGVIGRFNPRIISFMGYIPVIKPLVKNYAPAAARILARDGVDIVFLTPC